MMTMTMKRSVQTRRAADRIEAHLDEIEVYLAQIRAEAGRLKGDQADERKA